METNQERYSTNLPSVGSVFVATWGDVSTASGSGKDSGDSELVLVTLRTYVLASIMILHLVIEIFYEFFIDIYFWRYRPPLDTSVPVLFVKLFADTDSDTDTTHCTN